ncbi:MAG: tetratricopeptide repeat protein [Desulfobacterales bacterium]|nr:tetratricopeptide repeat protein [Desulfobacterales bacterium]
MATMQINDQSKIINQAIDLMNEKDNLNALKLFDQSIPVFPDMPGLKYGKAIALARIGHTDDAIDTLNELITTFPGHQKAKLLLTELSDEHVEEKNTNFHTNELDIKEKIAKILNKAFVLINEEGDIYQAFELLNTAKALKCPMKGIDYLRAHCFIKINQPDSARESLKEELRYFPENLEAGKMLDEIIKQWPQAISGCVGDTEFQDLLQVVRPYTMLSEERLFSLFSHAKQICIGNKPGNFVECGVAAGGSTALLAWVIKRYTHQPRLLYAFDSFEGMPEPTQHDTHNSISADTTGWGTGTCAANEDSVRELCVKLGVSDFVVTVKGYFQDSLAKMRNAVGVLSLLHLDGDWYESTKVILTSLYDQVVNDGFFQVDDYGYWEGCRKAVHEFEDDRKNTFNINPIDGTGVWFSKPDKFPLNPSVSKEWEQAFWHDDPVSKGVESQMSPNERFQLYYTARQLLPGLSHPVRFIEIGSYAGASLMIIDNALKNISHQLNGFSVEPAMHNQFSETLGRLKCNIKHLQMLSHQAVPVLKEIFEKDGNFPEFIIVDGDHTYEGVKRDIIDYYPLLAPGGIMLFHDYLPPLKQENKDAILFHHAGREPGIRQACQELMEEKFACEIIDIPLLYPTDPTQTQSYLPIIPGVFSTIRVYRKTDH